MIDVPIVEEKNIGEHMAVDEKYINGEFYTLLTNAKTGKIALMAATTKVAKLTEAAQSLMQKCFDVKVLTRDLASNYEWFGRQQFMNVTQVADKFHVLKHAFEAVQGVRIYHRQQLLSKRREAYEVYKLNKKSNPLLCFSFNEKKLSNGDTHQQLLARSQYLLYKHQEDWSASQKARASHLFKLYPDIEKAYNRVCEFRTWYSKENLIKENHDVYESMEAIKINLNKWMDRVNQDDITEMLNFKSLVERHRSPIINYFSTGATNAIAESNNAKIQALLNQNKGAKNLDFFYFRLKNFMA